jgi:hypothetical protein
MSTCARKHSWKSTPAHFRTAERDVLNNSYHDRWIGTGEPTAWPPRSPVLNPLDFYLRKHLETLGYVAPVDNEGELRRILGAGTSASLYGCGGPCWDVSRGALNFMEVILSTYYNCTISTITHKIIASRHVLIWEFFLVLVYGPHAQICPHFPVTPHIVCVYIYCHVYECEYRQGLNW